MAQADDRDDSKLLSFRSIWISDFHLGTRGSQAVDLLDFLRNTESRYLYLIGDIVDGWALKKKWYWPQTHNDVIQKLLRRARRGTEVVYVPGNHDEAARDYSGLHFGGILVMDKYIHVTAQNKRLLVLHGDQFDSVMAYAKWLAHLGDMAYQVLLGFNACLNWVRRKMGLSYWSLSAYLKAKVKKSVEFISSYETFIMEEARRQKVDGVVCGHIHTAEKRIMGEILYFNDGDWVESCTALVEDMEGNLRLINWRKEREALLATLA